MPFVIFRRFLRKYGSGSKVRTICLYTERTRILRKKKDGCRSDLVLEDGESSLFIGIPFPNCVFLGKVKERSGVMGEILNEPSIEVSEAKERWHLLLIRRNGPFQPIQSKITLVKVKPTCHYHSVKGETDSGCPK